MKRIIWNTFFASGYWVWLGLFFVLSLLLCWLHGRFWNRLLRRGDTPLTFFGTGLVSILALEELLCWPIVAFRLSANLLLALTAAVLLLPALTSFALPAEERERERPDWRLLALTGVLAAAAMAVAVCELHPDTDDSFYVSNVALFANSPVINPYDSSMGDPSTASVPMYDFQIWESLMSVLCRVFSVKATVLMHTLVVAPLIFCSLSACFCLGRALFRDSNRALLFTAVLTAYHLACRLYGWSEGCFLLTRIWQGKSVNLTVVLPLLSAEILLIFSEKDRRSPMLLWLCVLAGVGLNPTSLYINGFELLFLGIAGLILFPEGRKRAWALLPAAAITLAFTLMVYLRTKACPGKIESAELVSADFFRAVTGDFFGGMKSYQVLYALSLLYVLIRGGREAKAYFLLAAIEMLVFLWNPWAGRFVAEKITKEPTYWRVFWLVPMGAGISWAATELVYTRPERRRALMAGALLLVVCLSGEWVLKDYIPADNLEKIKPEILEISRQLRQEQPETPVLACRGVATVLRQEDTRLRLLVAKDSYVRDVYVYFGREEEGTDRLVLYDFANRRLEDCSSVEELLKKYEVRHVIIGKNNTAAIDCLEELGWFSSGEYGSYLLYKPSEEGG